MRPVNLIPPESRRGDRAPSRTGALPYVLIGALVVALAMVAFLTLTGNQIADRESEVNALEAREAEASARAEALRPYAEFASLAAARELTVGSLAASRFDWERVLRELALVMPDDVWLSEAVGTVSPNVQLESGTSVEGREAVSGPALALVGCGASHEAVAAFVAALRDIDGVTRVGLTSSQRPETQGDTSLDSGSGAPSTGATSDCRTRDFISRFEIIVAFDAVPEPAIPEAATAPETSPAAVPTAPETGSTAEGGEAAADLTAPTEQARESAGEQVGEAENAANIVPGVAR